MLTVPPPILMNLSPLALWGLSLGWYGAGVMLLGWLLWRRHQRAEIHRKQLFLLCALAGSAWVIGLWGTSQQAPIWGLILYGLLLLLTLAAFGWQWWRSRPPRTWSPQDWALAAVAPIAHMRGWRLDLLPGLPPTRRRKRRAKRFLRREWQISSSQDWLDTAEWLLETGHRMAFHAEINLLLDMDEAAAEVHLAHIRAGDIQPQNGEPLLDIMARMDWVQADGQAVQAHSYLAWDLLRLIDLCRWGVAAEWVDEDALQHYLLTASQALQQRYDSWLEMARQYQHGLRYWSAPAYQAQMGTWQQSITWLQQHRKSPWRQIPWQLPLSADVPAITGERGDSFT